MPSLSRCGLRAKCDFVPEVLIAGNQRGLILDISTLQTKLLSATTKLRTPPSGLRQDVVAFFYKCGKSERIDSRHSETGRHPRTNFCLPRRKGSAELHPVACVKTSLRLIKWRHRGVKKAGQEADKEEDWGTGRDGSRPANKPTLSFSQAPHLQGVPTV